MCTYSRASNVTSKRDCMHTLFIIKELPLVISLVFTYLLLGAR
jgi:hypothetical protein